MRVLGGLGRGVLVWQRAGLVGSVGLRPVLVGSGRREGELPASSSGSGYPAPANSLGRRQRPQIARDRQDDDGKHGGPARGGGLGLHRLESPLGGVGLVFGGPEGLDRDHAVTLLSMAAPTSNPCATGRRGSAGTSAAVAVMPPAGCFWAGFRIGILGAESGELAGLDDADEIDGDERAGPVRNDDRDAAARLDAFDRLGEGGLALAVEIGVRLVHHHQERIAVERAGQADALALAGRERGALRAQLRLVAIWQLHDHLVNAGSRCRGDDGGGIGALCEPGDILADAGVEQGDLLRQVAEIATDRVFGPLLEMGAIEPHRAAQARPDPGDGPHQRGLAAAAGADDPERLAGGHIEGDLAQQDLAGARRRDGDAIDLEILARRRQLHRLDGIIRVYVYNRYLYSYHKMYELYLVIS